MINIELTSLHYEMRIKNKRDCYIDKDNLKQYINTLEGIVKQDIPLFNRTIMLPKNSLLNVDFDLYYQWDFVKNNILNFDIYKATSGSCAKAWWICINCGSSYYSRIIKRVGKQKNCVYCFGQKVNHTNSLASLNPTLAKEWHPTKNGELTPQSITTGSNKKAWWMGECGHEWEAVVSSRTKGNGCPYCANNKILIGFNDMWTTNPELASMLANHEDGYTYPQWSSKLVDWKCCNCKSVIKSKKIRDINDVGLSCNICSDGVSFPEKFMYNFLLLLNVDIIKQKSFDWLKGKKYDFYIPSMNMIIETHGLQHYIDSFSKLGGRTTEEEQLNDKLKYESASKNGIEYYITIDCRNSEFDFICNSILNSEMNNIFNLDNVDWKEVYRNSCKSLMKEACEMWNSENISVAEIANRMNMSISPIYNYIRRGVASGLCESRKN